MARRNSRVSQLAGGLSRSVGELVNQSNQTYNPRSYDGMANKPFIVQREDYDREKPPKDEMKKYWRQYETTPIVRKPINAFANRIIEPGYYIEAPDDADQDVIDELHEWLENAAIVEGELEQDIYFLIKKAAIQREVRGTAIIEKVYAKEDRDVLMALKMLNPETIEANTRPGQAILLDPEDHEQEDWDPPLTPEGTAAAYLQDLSETQVSWGRTEKIRRIGAGPEGDSRYPNRVGFERDDIIKLTRDADTGEIFGTSRIETVSDRIDGLKQKLQDNDEAIASKAYPLWLFRFGVGPDATPWSREDIDNFMTNHEMENFHPGMKQGVRGDVEIDTISGEVADIGESLQFDLDWILSAMPMARQALGGFAGQASGGGAEVAGMAQENNIVRQIDDARKELSHRFTPCIQDKAEELGLDEETALSVKFRVGDPNQERPDEDPGMSTSRIEYHGVGNDEGDGDGQIDAPPEQIPPGQQQEDEDDEPSDADIGPFGDRRGIVTATEASELSTAQLQGAEDELHSLIEETVLGVREAALDDTEQSYRNSATEAAYKFPRAINDYIDRATSRNFERDVERIVEDELRTVEYARDYSVEHKNRVNQFSNDIVNATYEVLEDMASDMRVQFKRGAHDNDEWDTVRSRLENVWDSGSISSRAYIVAHMELHNARETTKLTEFEMMDDVVGVRIHNPDSSTPLTQEAHGVEAFFDDGAIGHQFREQIPDRFYHEGFDPLPTTPPYHFGDTTVLEPIFDDEVDEDE